MRLLTLFALGLIVAGLSMPVMAEEAAVVQDEFGARFTAEAPPAFGDDPAAALADIMPAAGDETEIDTDDQQEIEKTDTPEDSEATSE